MDLAIRLLNKIVAEGDESGEQLDDIVESIQLRIREIEEFYGSNDDGSLKSLI